VEPDIPDDGLRIVKFGQANRDETPTHIRDRNIDGIQSGISEAKKTSDRELESFLIGNTINACASAIQAYKRVVG
jgi:hypothetical protein